MFRRAVHPGQILRDELTDFGGNTYRILPPDRCAAESDQPDHRRQAIGDG